MAEEILLDYELDRPNVSVDQNESEVKILLKINASNALRAAERPAAINTNVALVLDVSSSMRTRELDALKEAARFAVRHLSPGDYITVVAFQSVAYDIVTPTLIVDSSTIADVMRKIDVIDQFQGGGTDMEYALERAASHLAVVPNHNQVRKIVIFTDGMVTGIPENCLKTAQQISSTGIVIDALGFGTEFDYKFMQRLVSYSNGVTELVQRPEEIASVLQRRVQSATSAVATNVRLDLHFTPQIRANRGYRYSPEIAYLGRIRLPGESRNIQIPVGAIERDKEYAYVITVAVPARPAGKVRIVKADLYYDVPSLGVKDGSSSQSIILNYTDDPQAVSNINGGVERAYDEVEIGRLVEELDGSMKKQEHQNAAMLFDILEERYRELGDVDMAAHYTTLKAKYSREGALTQEDMNYTRHKSTQKRESGVQLVDASNLI